MKPLHKTYRFLREKYRLFASKRYTTLAGTLVFFFIMSIVPLSFWLTLLFGRLPIDMDKFLRLPVFESVQNVLLFVQKEAANATAGVSVVLIVSTLYSSTNLFYQMRRSGEIIYDYRRLRSGLHLRVGALALTFIIMLMFVVFFALFALGTFLFSRYFSLVWERIADYTLLIALSFALVFLLNMYVCPYKTHVKRFLPGTCVTVAAWSITAVGFSFYLRLSNMRKLYGALSTIIVFLLWLYVLMICFIVGVIVNSEKITAERKAANAARSHRRNSAKRRQTNKKSGASA